MKLSPHYQSHVRAGSQHGPFGLNPVTAVVLMAFGVVGAFQSVTAKAAEPDQPTTGVMFDTTFLRTDASQPVDVARFAHGNNVSPGVYMVDVWLNGTRVAREEVRFVAQPNGDGARACLSRKLLRNLGVDFAKVVADTGAKTGDAADVHEGKSGGESKREATRPVPPVHMPLAKMNASI